MSFDACVITCEHATNAVPVRWREPFAGSGDVLDSHRGWDPGALVMARDFARALKAPLLAGQVSRLLVDLNRRETARAVFSDFARQLEPEQRLALLNNYHRPYRVAVLDAVRDARNVLHLSCHSFTPVLNGSTRRAEIGLLYDPARPREAEFCRAWRAGLRLAMPSLRVRRNYPYHGTSDGITSWLREKLDGARYVGIELELNQAFAAQTPMAWARVRRALIATLPLQGI